MSIDFERVRVLASIDLGDGPGMSLIDDATIDGRPIDPWERDLLAGCTLTEFEAVVALVDLRALEAQQLLVIMKRLEHLLRDWFDASNRFGDDLVVGMGEAIAALPPAERAEAEAISEMLWPDGWIEVPR